MEQNFINRNQSQEEPRQNPSYIPNINSSSSDTIYNSTQNITPPEEPYYSSKSTNNAQQYPSPPYPAQPYPAQNMVVPPNQSYYPSQGTQIQPGVPISSFPLQPEALNIQPIPQNQYYKPYSLVQHKGILQTETNTYYIKTGYFLKIFPFFPFFMGSFIMIPIGFVHLPHTLVALIFGLIFLSCSILCCCKMYHSAFFILGPNTLTVIKKAMCNKKCTIYNPGDLERIDFTNTLSKKGKRNVTVNNYILKVVEKNGNIDVIFNTGSKTILFTSDEIEYFLYTVNTHIQTKMKV